jgi:putative ABC transport system permease protein
MTLTGLAVRNLGRNKFRVTLTALGVAVAILAFLLLRTVLGAWTRAAEFAAKDRVATRNKVTFVMPLPKRYVDDVRNTPHIKTATWANWFGGKDPKHDREFFATLAIDTPTYFTVYDELKVAADDMTTFQHDKQGAIVGDLLAKKLGWKVGDRVILQSGIYPGDWEVRIEGIYTATAKSVDRSTLFFHWDYVNDAIPPDRRDQIGWITSRVDDPPRAADIAVTLDKRFEDAETPTLSQDEGTFRTSFLAAFSAILSAMNIVSGVILAIMTLIIGNTIAMGVRERTNEYGVLRAIGFLPGHVALWVVGESLVMGVLGGVLGVGVAWVFINYAAGPFLEENMANYFPYFQLSPANAVLGLALAALLGAAASALPAYLASKLNVVDAVRRVA